MRPDAFTPIPEFPGYEIDRAGHVRRADSKGVLELQHRPSGSTFVNMRQGPGKWRSRSINVLLVETFGAGAAASAGLPEPDMGWIAKQRELCARPRSGKSLGGDATPHRKTRRCHDCGRPTNQYRCDRCWKKLRGFGFAEADDYHTGLA